MDPDELVPIGTFARAARLTVKALRHYDALGVLRPATVNPDSRYRYYRWSQLPDALLVGALRSLGVPLGRISEHVADGVPLADVIEGHRHELEREQTRITAALATIGALARGEEPHHSEVTEVDRPEVPSLRAETGTDAALVAGAAAHLIEELLEHADASGLSTEPPVVGAYPFELAETIGIAVHLPVGPGPLLPRAVTGRFRQATLPGGRFARTLHVGPHESLPLAYGSLVQWLATTGQPAVGTVYERYVDDPTTTPPDQLRTEVLVRVA